MVDVVLGDLVDVLGQRQAVGRHAQLDVRGLFGELLESLESAARVGQGVSRSGDAEYRHLRNLGGNGEYLLDRLIRRQQLGDDARTGFVRAVILAVAVIALNVAGRRHGDVHAGEVVVCLLGITGMVLYLGTDVIRQVGQTIRRRAATAGGATTALGGCCGIADNGKFHDEGSSNAVRSLFSKRCANRESREKTMSCKIVVGALCGACRECDKSWCSSLGPPRMDETPRAP